MKKYLTIVILFNFILSWAQNTPCTPDPQYAGESANLYPAPYHERLNPNGGILDSACINKLYSFVFTAVVPDSFPTDFGTIKLDSIVIEANPLVNAPTGISVSCNPPNCKFTSGTIGCLELNGTPSSSNQVKVYDLSLKVKISLLDGLILIRDTLPSFLSDSAHYYLPLFEENSPNCNSTSYADVADSKFDCRLFPNPAYDNINIKIGGDDFFYGKLEVSDINGRVIMSDVLNDYEYNIDVSNYNPGIYILNIITDRQLIRKKFIIQK